MLLPTVRIKEISLELDPSNYRASYRGKPLHLTIQQFAILYILAQNPNRLIKHEQIARNLWPTRPQHKVPARNLIKTVIHHIRNELNRIEPTPDADRIIVTRHGLGYELRTRSVDNNGNGQHVAMR